MFVAIIDEWIKHQKVKNYSKAQLFLFMRCTLDQILCTLKYANINLGWFVKRIMNKSNKRHFIILQFEKLPLTILSLLRCAGIM